MYIYVNAILSIYVLYIYIYIYIYNTHAFNRKLVIEKEKILLFAAAWKDLEGIMCYTEWNISDRERKMLYVVTYMLTLKNETLMNTTKQK